jgi:hypothetical protein
MGVAGHGIGAANDGENGKESGGRLSEHCDGDDDQKMLQFDGEKLFDFE